MENLENERGDFIFKLAVRVIAISFVVGFICGAFCVTLIK
jgi:hypothetical protein